MKKLRLDLDEISVETFSVTPTLAESAGTVEGQQSGLPSCTMFCTIQWGSACGNTQGCQPSAEIYCPTATCHDGCTADCPGYPAYTWNQTCPPTCHLGGGCESTQPECPL